MATINNKLIHFKSKSDFNGRYAESTDDGKTYGDFLGTSIVFIQDAKQIWTHGQFYDANETTLASLGVTATAEELNYVDGVTSNIQTQLSGKAASSHNHNASDINAGTLDIARIPTGTSASTVALGNHTHTGYAASSHIHSTANITVLTAYTEGTSTTTLNSAMSLNAALASLQNQIQDKVSSSSLDDYALKSEIPDISDLATKTELAGYLPLTGGTLSGSLFVKEFGAGLLYIENAGIGLKSTNTGDDPISIMGGGIALNLTSSNDFTINNAQILTEANWNDYITSTDTKNTTGTFQSTAKLYLVGGASQSSTGVVTYSNGSVYMQSGQLYASRMNATTGFYETSDATLKNFKEDIKALEIISKIPTKYFTWKKNELDEKLDPELHIGTSAQEIQKLYPDLVTADEDGILSVDYARLSIVALAAIKELKAELDELKNNK